MHPNHRLAVCFGCFALVGCGHATTYEIESSYSISEPQFARTMGSLLGPPIIDGNAVTTLQNGDEIFPAMLEAIRSAQKTITFETFVYWSGTIGAEFSRALAERAQAGVKVHVIVDAVGGSEMEDEYADEMRNAGVELELYKPLRWNEIGTAHKLNYRTHRKLLITDGRTASRAASASPTSGVATPTPRSIGATTTTSSPARSWRNSRRPSWTIGSRQPVSSWTVWTTSRRSSPLGRFGHRCSRARPTAATRACS